MYTTTYTITSCPTFDRSCETGVVTTQTLTGAATTETASDNDRNNDDDEDNAALKGQATSLLLFTLMSLTVACNAF